MFRDSMKGLERVFLTEPPEGSVVMIVGRPGTMKSSIAHQIIASYLWNHSKEGAVYVTLEETKKSHLRNMRSLGISFPEKQYFIKDMASFTDILAPSGAEIYWDEGGAEILIKEIFSTINQDRPGEAKQSILGFDSMNALQALFGIDSRKMRFMMQNFFMNIRKREMNALIIMEGDPDMLSQEYFMADGIIEVGVDRSTPHLPKRYLLVHKMRGTQHDMAPHMINITKNGLEIGEPLIGWKGR